MIDLVKRPRIKANSLVEDTPTARKARREKFLKKELQKPETAIFMFPFFGEYRQISREEVKEIPYEMQNLIRIKYV